MTNKSEGAPDFIPTEPIQWGSSWPELVGDSERNRLFSYLEVRFGISVQTFDDFLVFRREKSWSILKKTPHIGHVSRLKVDRVGLRAFQKVGAFVKPSTRLIQIFGHLATRAVVDVDQAQLADLVKGNPLFRNCPVDKGYVILRLESAMVLGLGFYADGHVRSQLPKKEINPVTL